MKSRLTVEQARAGTASRTEERVREQQKGMAEWEAEHQLVRDKSLRLRALRLARDAAISSSDAPSDHGDGENPVDGGALNPDDSIR